jgi:hypothetical protein
MVACTLFDLPSRKFSATPRSTLFIPPPTGHTVSASIFHCTASHHRQATGALTAAEILPAATLPCLRNNRQALAELGTQVITQKHMLPPKVRGVFNFRIIPAAMDALDMFDVVMAIERHTAKDWGDVSPTTRRKNEKALKHGGRLFLVHYDRHHVKFFHHDRDG